MCMCVCVSVCVCVCLCCVHGRVCLPYYLIYTDIVLLKLLHNKNGRSAIIVIEERPLTVCMGSVLSSKKKPISSHSSIPVFFKNKMFRRLNWDSL